MTSNPPPEATHFGGNTLTPESPAPIHLPDSSNIPVLQNQIDPIFNLTSTHLQPLLTVSNSGMAALRTAPEPLDVARPGPESKAIAGDSTDGNFISFEANQEIDAEGDDDSNISYGDEEAADEQSQEVQANNTLQYLSSSDAHPSKPADTHDFPSPAQTDETSALIATLNESSVEEAIEHTAGPTELSQDALTANDQAPNGEGHLEDPDQRVKDGGVNYETLLESLSPSTSTSPSAESIASSTTAIPAESSVVPRPSSSEQPLSALPLPPGLPPRPPPQEKPAIHPNYNAENDISTFHFPQNQNTNAQSSHNSQPTNSFAPSQGFPQPVPTSKASVGANGLPPPPLATFQQPSPQPGHAQPSPFEPQHRPSDGKNERPSGQAVQDSDDEVPWTPEIEKLWNEFQREEAIYVSEGLWDRFPAGSRLFVGNLFTEKVTKRDLFFVFHRYGRLAQISIKNAYGFIQYLDASCCQRALQAEQGMPARGRKMHLEISKPQKNSRNAAASAAGDSLRAGNRRRSRSPDYGRGSQRTGGQRNGADRYGSNGNSRVEARRRDDYRPMRSPSPRGFRGRDDYYGPRGRSPDRYYGGRRSRSRSPYNRHGRYRSRSPQDLDDEASLPFPRRDVRDVPDVQIILIDQVDRTFVGYIEKSFRDRGLRCDVLQLPRVSLIAVVKRQIIEGVQAVVKIFRQSQVTGKIPLQVFDRRQGADNVRFEEYEELDANIAAELVVRAKATHVAPQPTQHYPAPPYSAPQYGQTPQQMPPQQQQQQAGAPNLATLITSLDGPALQKLLGAMSQSPQTPQNPQHPQFQSQQQPDLTALLSGVNRQPQGYSYGVPQQQQQQQQQPPPQQQQYNTQTLNHTFANNPALASLLANTANRGPQPPLPQQQYQPGQQPQVQNIMEQLNRWKQ